MQGNIPKRIDTRQLSSVPNFFVIHVDNDEYDKRLYILTIFQALFSELCVLLIHLILTTLWIDNIVILFCMRKLKHGEVKQFGQGHS